MLPVVVQVPVDGSYNSALFRGEKLIILSPPATNTFPFVNTHAV
jgi:hypothetical protein